VQICEAVGESWTEVEQRTRWFLRHASVSIRSAGDNTLEQPQHAPHFRDPIERSNDVDF
jgi:hypothetical protein